MHFEASSDEHGVESVPEAASAIVHVFSLLGAVIPMVSKDGALKVLKVRRLPMDVATQVSGKHSQVSCFVVLYRAARV